MMISRILLAVAALFLVPACVSTADFGGQLSDEAYLDLSVEDRAKYVTTTRQDAKDLVAKRELEQDPDVLRSGMPMKVGTAETGATLMCVPQPGEFNAVAVYPGHDPKGIGNKYLAQLYFLADNDCQIMYAKNEATGQVSPMKVMLADSAQSEDAFKFGVRIATQLGDSVIRGPITQMIANADDCNGCGVTYANIVEGSIAVAEAAALSESNLRFNQNNNGNTGGCGGSCPDIYNAPYMGG